MQYPDNKPQTFTWSGYQVQNMIVNVATVTGRASYYQQDSSELQKHLLWKMILNMLKHSLCQSVVVLYTYTSFFPRII